MGNIGKRQRVRNGISRPGPAAKATAARLHEEQHTLVAQNARERKSRQRSRDRERHKEALILASTTPNVEVEDSLLVKELNRISLRVAQYLVQELRCCPSPQSRRDVVERVLRHNSVSPSLLEYYARPQEAKVIHLFIENFKNELQLVKVANSNELLARKSALLDAAVSLGIDGVRPLSRVLEMSTRSITVALNRRIQVGDTEETILGLRLHRKKKGGLSDYVKHCIELWWNVQTKVSPNRK